MLLAPEGDRVARVAPWDAAYRLHAELCRRRPIVHVQRVEAIAPLGLLGHVVVMERLWSAPEAAAAALCAALVLTGDSSGWTPPADLEPAFASDDPHLQALRRHVMELAAEGARLPFWGGLDVRPGNVMQDGAGVLKLIDPVFVAGPKIIAAIERGDRDALSQLQEGALAAFFQIPPFQAGGNALKEAALEMGLLAGE